MKRSASGFLLPFTICMVVAMPGVILRLSGFHASAPVQSVAFGAVILAAAFILTWASEAAQMDVPRAFAVVVLSLIAVLPEYAVDVVFAWEAGKDPSRAPLAIANMTGANRLLVGIAWPLVWWLHARKRRLPKLRTPRELALEVMLLVVAGFTVGFMALKGSLSVLDGAILAGIFAFYAFLSIRSGGEEPHAVGPAASLMALPKGQRRLCVVLLLSAAAGAIFLVAHPFAESLVASGRALGISEFVLVQWVAPFASEAPEVVVAVLLVLNGRSSESIAVLVSSKVNQFTLLVGCLPFAYAASAGGWREALPLNPHQVAEVAVTSAQTLFAAATIANRTLGRKGGLTLFGLFLAQLVATESLELFSGRAPTDPEGHALWRARVDEREIWSRWIFAAVYGGLGVALVFLQWEDVKRNARSARERVRRAFTF